jgi:N-acetyl-anhydromuramyl-L-alanine amidase AmpD
MLALEDHPSPNHSAGRNGARPLAVVVHTTAGTWAGTLDWFSRGESGVSAHYLVGLDGRVAQLVDETDTARHAGRVLTPSAPLILANEGSDPNELTIGIEFEDGGDPLAVRRPASQYAAGARLLAGIARRWSIPLDREHVIGHREIYAAKECPGNLDVERLVSEARASAG